MKKTRVLAVAVLIIGGGLALDVAQSQQAGVASDEVNLGSFRICATHERRPL